MPVATIPNTFLKPWPFSPLPAGETSIVLVDPGLQDELEAAE